MFQNFNQAPALEPGDGARLGDADNIADLGFAFLVVDVEFFDLLDDLAEFCVRDAGDGLDDDGLGHLVRDHLADAGLAKAAGVLGFGCGRGRGGSVSHT